MIPKKNGLQHILWLISNMLSIRNVLAKTRLTILNLVVEYTLKQRLLDMKMPLALAVFRRWRLLRFLACQLLPQISSQFRYRGDLQLFSLLLTHEQGVGIVEA